MQGKQLYRSCKNRILGGVCGGLGEYFEIDPILVRLIMILLAVGGAGIVLYIIAWIIIPEDPSCVTAKKGSEEIREKAESMASEIKARVSENGHRQSEGRTMVGLIIIAIGIIFLLQRILGFNFWTNLWPIIIIIVGLAILLGGSRR